MESKDRVSIIIPSFNRKIELRECLRSIYSQNYPNFEVLVIDNASSDGTKEMVLGEFPHAILFCNKKNLYACKARNLGVAKSSGTYLWFLDSDSVIPYNNCLTTMVALMESDSRIGSIGGTVYLFQNGDKMMVLPQNGRFNMISDWDNSFYEIAECDYLPTSNLLIKKDLFAKIGGFVEIYKYLLEDNDLGLKITLHGLKNIADRKAVVIHPFKPAANDFKKSYIFYRNTFLYIFLNYRCKKWHEILINKFNKSRFSSTGQSRCQCLNQKTYTLNKFSVYSGLLFGLVNSLFLLPTSIFIKAKYGKLNYITRYSNEACSERWFNFKKATIKLLNCTLFFLEKMPKFISNILITTFILFRRTKLQMQSIPTKVIFFVTNRCNLGCKHCFYRDYINQEIDELNCEEIEKIFSSFSKKLDNICITGGEPFLRSDLIEICEMLSNKKIAKSITIPTSGYDSNFIAGNILKILKNTNLKLYIQISLDGLETTHDQLRNTPGLFSEAVSLIKRLKQMQNCISNLFVSIMTTVLEYNYIELLALDNFIHREFSNISHDFQFVRYGKDVGGIVDTNLIEASHPYNPIFDSPSIESCREIIRQYENNHKANRIVHWKLLVKKYHLDIVEKKKKILPCLAGKLSVIIYPNGDVSFCEMLKPFANFRDFAYDFQKVWKSDITRQKKPSIRHCFCTYSCAISDAIPYDKNAILKFINHKF